MMEHLLPLLPIWELFQLVSNEQQTISELELQQLQLHFLLHFFIII